MTEEAKIFNAIRRLNTIREQREELEAAAIDLVAAARTDGKDWDEIGAALGMGGGQAYVMYAHLIRESCGNCWRCTNLAAQSSLTTYGSSRMILCEKCGNKRCPHATDHDNECTASNEPGQEGSVYA